VLMLQAFPNQRIKLHTLAHTPPVA
jgi:hypothetical protein